MKKPYLSVVIPSYNEVENIKRGVLWTVYDYLKKQNYSWELILVDDRSKDETVKLLRGFAKNKKKVKVLDEPHRGKGGTVIAGTLAAKGEIVLFTDMDQATPIDQVEKVLPKFAEGFDVVIGSRKGRKGSPLSRKLMAYGFVVLRKIVLGLPYKDTQCGFKAFRLKAAEKIFKKMRIFGSLKEDPQASVTAGFDLELLYLARKLRMKISEVSVLWHYKETERVSAVKDSIEALRHMLRVKVNAIMGKYD